MVIPSTPHNGILITIVGLIISAPFFIWAYILYKRQNENKGKPSPVPPPLDRSVKEKLPNGRTLTTYPPNIFQGRPESENKVQKVMFDTESRHEVLIPTYGGKPRTLRFIYPHEQVVQESDLPTEIPTGDGRLVVKKFTPKGFVIDELSTYGVKVEVEVYLK